LNKPSSSSPLLSASSLIASPLSSRSEVSIIVLWSVLGSFAARAAAASSNERAHIEQAMA
jgi:hypothetical protein